MPSWISVPHLCTALLVSNWEEWTGEKVGTGSANPWGATGLCLGAFIAHLFKGLWHAPIHEALAVLVGLSESWRRDGWRLHEVFKSERKETGCRRVNQLIRVSKTTLVPHKSLKACQHILTVPGKAGGRNQTLAQRLLSLVGDGPVVGENSAL